MGGWVEKKEEASGGGGEQRWKKGADREKEPKRGGRRSIRLLNFLSFLINPPEVQDILTGNSSGPAASG